MFPIIPILAILGILGGGVTLAWYSNLSGREKQRANIKANAIALSMFKKGLSQLNSRQYEIVMDKTRKTLKD